MNKATLLFVCMVALTGCVTTPAPEGAVPGRIRVVANTDSPFWASQINDYFPKALGDYAHYEIATFNSSAPYTLQVKLLSASTKESGLVYRGNRAIIEYTTTVEARVELLNRSGTTVWNYSGYAYDSSPSRAIKRFAKMVAKGMADNGLFLPSYYSDITQQPKGEAAHP